MLLWPGIDSSAEVKALRRRARLAVATLKEKPEHPETVSEEAPEHPWAPFTVGDSRDILSVAFAMRRGYRIVLDGDGVGEVTNPTRGRSYYILDFQCDCPDRRRGGSYNGHCKHEHWLGQMRPCEICGGIMFLGEFRTAFGEVLRRFECPGCGNALDFHLVCQERVDRSRAGGTCQRLSPDDRCRQAVDWFKTWRNPKCIWSLLDHAPQLAPALLGRLLEEGEQDLADRVATKHGFALQEA